jgi:hypothetical protein
VEHRWRRDHPEQPGEHVGRALVRRQLVSLRESPEVLVTPVACREACRDGANAGHVDDRAGVLTAGPQHLVPGIAQAQRERDDGVDMADRR